MSAIEISIIVPTYNSELTVLRCLDSIIGQTFRSYEILVIDNLSTDKTTSILKIYQEKYSNFNFISEDDGGVYEAMNKGIGLAKGKWIYFLGSDDYLVERDVLLNFYHLVSNKKSKCHFIYGNVTSPVLGEKYDGKFDVKKLISKNICHQAIFYNKDVFCQIGLFNTKYKYLSDYEFNMRCFARKRIRKTYIDLTIAYFSEGGLSNTKWDHAFYEDYPDAISKMRKYAYSHFLIYKLKQYCKLAIKTFRKKQQAVKV